MTFEKKQFMFVHIPKTAGTTIALVLARHFKHSKILSFYPPKDRSDFYKLSSKTQNQFDLCYGHIPFKENNKLERGIEYFTFLRKPRERLLSGYKYIKSNKHQGRKNPVKLNDTLKDFLKKGELKNMDNTMVRFLSGGVDRPYLDINESDLNVALKNFDTYFTIFGLTEYFDESLVLLSDYMKWPQLFYVRENKSTFKINPSEFDDEVETLIARCNKYDDILYRHAHERFIKLLQQKKEVVDLGLIELREGNEKRKFMLKIRSKASVFVSFLKIKISRLLN